MPTRQRSRARLALFATAALVGLAAIAYAALPLVLAAWMQAVLTDHGFSHVRIRIGYPTLHQLRVHLLELTSQRGGRTYRFSARDLQVDYDTQGLASGRVRRLHVPDAALHVVAAAPPMKETSVPLIVPVPMPGEWIAAFPLQALDVDRCNIEWSEEHQPGFTAVVRGEVRRDAEHLNTRWTLTQDGHARYEFALDLTADGALNTTLLQSSAPQTPLLRATVTVAPQDRETVAINGSAEAQLKPLMPLLAPWLAIPPTVSGLDGRLKASWHGKMPAALTLATGNILRGSSIEGSVLLDARVARAGSILQDGRLYLDASFNSHDASLHWRIRDNLQLSAYLNPALLSIPSSPNVPFVRTPKPLVIRAPHGLSGELTITPAEYRITAAPRTSFVVEQLHAPIALIATMTATLTHVTRVNYHPASGEWETGGLALTVTAPAIQPQYAEIGAFEDLAVSATLGAGPLTRVPPLLIGEAAVTLLGGRVTTRALRYDGIHESPFDIEIAHLDLARVVALEQQQGIEASGLLDGHLPVTLTPRGLSIADGKLSAQPSGGVIRYQGTDRVREMAATNPNLKLVLNALANYQYDKLDVGVDYAEGGELVLQLALTGRNPNWNAGQPIHLNVSITENIPILLRSLRLADDISVELEKRMKERSRPKH